MRPLRTLHLQTPFLRRRLLTLLPAAAALPVRLLLWRRTPVDAGLLAAAGILFAIPSLISPAAAGDSGEKSLGTPMRLSESRGGPHVRATIDPAPATDDETPAAGKLTGQAADSPATLAPVVLDHTSPAQPQNNAVDWQKLTSIRLSVTRSRIAVARAESAIVRHRVEAARRIESAELKAQIARRNLKQYIEGESKRERARLQSQLTLSRDRHQQLQEQLEWSERLANEGLISQATLEIDNSAVRGSASELRAAETRLTVFQTIELERIQTQLEADVSSTEAELKLLRQNEQSRSLELQRDQTAAQRELDLLQAHAKELNQSEVVKPDPASVHPVQLAGQTTAVESAHSAMLRAKQELAAIKSYLTAAFSRYRQLQKVRKLELEAFRRGQHSGTLHELSSRIRIAMEKLAADQQQLTWSRRVIRKGYITPAELRSAELAVSKRKAELANVLQQKDILSEHTLDRDEFELQEKLRHASNELIRQEHLAEARIRELTIVAEAKLQAWEVLQETLAMLRGRQQGAAAEAGGG